jgi:hypothetical protein
MPIISGILMTRGDIRTSLYRATFPIVITDVVQIPLFSSTTIYLILRARALAAVWTEPLILFVQDLQLGQEGKARVLAAVRGRTGLRCSAQRTGGCPGGGRPSCAPRAAMAARMRPS